MNETKLENGPAAASEGIDKTAGTLSLIHILPFMASHRPFSSIKCSVNVTKLANEENALQLIKLKGFNG